MKVALVHDYPVERGGTERVVAVPHQTFPDAPIHTSVYSRAIQGIASKEMQSGLVRMEKGGDVALQSGEART